MKAQNSRTTAGGLIAAIGILSAAMSLLGFAGGVWWPFDLISHFRVQFFIGLTMITLVLLAGPRKWAGAIVGAVALLNGLVLAPCFWGGGDRQAVANTPPLRLVLTNVNTANDHYSLVIDYIRSENPDLFVVEEVSALWMTELAPLREAYPYVVNQSREDNFGIAIFSRLPLVNTKEITDRDGFGVPSLVAETSFAGRTLSIVATHPFPPRGRLGTHYRNKQLVRIGEVIQQLDGPVILLGDLNVSPWSVHFSRLLRQTRLVDSARGWGVQPTWPVDSILTRVPIDHCLLTSDFTVINREVGPDVGSDHFPLAIEVALAPK